MYLINTTNNNFIQQNDVNTVATNHPHNFINNHLNNNHLNNHNLINHNLTNHNSTNLNLNNYHFTPNQNHNLTNHNSANLNLNNYHFTPNQNHNLNNNIRNSASYNCIVSNKTPPLITTNIPHHSATNLNVTTSNNTLTCCFNCKNHHHNHLNQSTSITKLSSSNTSLTNGGSSSINNIYNRNKLEQSLLEAKLRVAQLKKELQSSKLNSNQYLNSLTSLNNNNNNDSQDQVDYALFSSCKDGTTSRESQIRMLNNYMQEAVESVYGSQSNSRHSSQQQLPLIKQGLSSSSISTDASLRNSTSSVHLNNHHFNNNNNLNNQLLQNHNQPYLKINHNQCNHQISTSDSCASISENIYSNQQIINNLNKSKSANTINSSYQNKSLINLNDNNQLEQSLIKARQRVIQLKKDLENNSENYVIYSNQSAILAQQKQQLEQSQKVNSNNEINNLNQLNQINNFDNKVNNHFNQINNLTNQTTNQVNNNNVPSIDESLNLLTIIDKYYRKNDNSTAVEV